EHEVVAKLLSELAAGMPGNIQPLEWLLGLYRRTSDPLHLADALAHLGDALVAAHQWDRAKKTYEQLVEREPESDSAKRKLNGVLRKMGLPTTGIAEELPEENLLADIPKPPAAKLPVEDEEAAPETAAKPAVKSSEPALDEETQKFIAQSLTDVDLFASYGLTQKAIGLLEAILRRAPRHAPTLEKLLDFVLGAGDDRRTAELAAQLEQIHTERGDVRSAERFEELRRRFQRAAGLTDEELAPQRSAAPELQPTVAEVAPEQAALAEPAAPATEEVHEVDLSDEWASMLSDTRPAEPGAKTPTAREDGAAEFEVPIEAAQPENTNPFAESSAGTPSTEDLPDISIRREAHETASIFEKDASAAEPPLRAQPPAPAAPPREKPPAKGKTKAPEPEFDVEQEYELVLDAEPLVPAHEQKPPTPPAAPRKREPVHQNSA